MLGARSRILSCLGERSLVEVRVRVLYFGQARELSGISEEFHSLPSPVYVDQLISVAMRAHPKLEEIRRILRVLVNGRSVSDNLELKEGDRVAVVPPIAGG